MKGGKSMNRKIVALVLALLMVFSFTSMAAAAPYDLLNLETNDRYGFNQFVDSPDVFDDVVANQEDFVMEADNGNYYRITEIQQRLDAGAVNFNEAIQGLEPVEIAPEELEVIEVSAIMLHKGYHSTHCYLIY